VAVWGEASSAAILCQHCGRHGLLQHVTGLLEFWLQGFFSRLWGTGYGAFISSLEGSSSELSRSDMKPSSIYQVFDAS